MIVVCVCDGFDKIPKSFKKYATEKGFFDENLLREKGFMKPTRDKDEKGEEIWTMKTMSELMDPSV
jgi:hypothetical protein